MAMSAEQLQMMTQVIAETLKQIHEAKTIPGGPSLVSGNEDMKMLVKEIATQMKGNGGQIHNKSILDERHFRRLEKFSNKEADWEAWQANVEVAVAAVHSPTAKVMDEVAKKEAVDIDKVKEIFGDMLLTATWNEELFMAEMAKASGELYQHLCLWTTGEANTIVRAVREKDGFIAWKRLLTKFAPRTAARRLQAMMNIMRPVKAKDVRSFGKALESWELSVSGFKANFNETLSMNMQVAVVIGMAPGEIQDIIFQQWKGEGDEADLEKDWKMVRDKVMAMVANRASMSTPTPMDIGRVEDGWGEDWPCGDAVHYLGGSGYEEEEGSETNIGAVGKGGKGDGRCRRCGGKGHFARECSTPFGKGVEKGGENIFQSKGKGQKGKGYPGKGQYLPGDGDKGKGKGKGYQGTCFNCGKVGHKAAECRQVASVDKEGDESTVDSVWLVAKVENIEPDEQIEEAGWQAVDNKTTKKNKRKKKKMVGIECEDADVQINQVTKKGWESSGKSEVTVDSAADESVCQKGWGDMFELKEVQEGKEMKLMSANGGKIAHYGRRDVTFEVEGENDTKLMGMGFQVSDVKKPLASVYRIVEKGNRVQFGPSVADNFIQNVQTGEKVFMRRKGRSYVLDVEFAKKVNAVSQPFQRQP